MNLLQTITGNEVFSYWLELTRQQSVPLQREFEPARVRHRLPDLFILGQDTDGKAIFRLAGTRLCAAFGHELRGAAFSGLWHESQTDQIAALVETVLSEASPVVSNILGMGRDTSRTCEMLLLPMRSSQPQADRILGALIPHAHSTGLSERLDCLYWRDSRRISDLDQQQSTGSQRFSRFMRRLLSVEIADDGQAGHR